jgi:hypothetical protein
MRYTLQLVGFLYLQQVIATRQPRPRAQISHMRHTGVAQQRTVQSARRAISNLKYESKHPVLACLQQHRFGSVHPLDRA